MTLGLTRISYLTRLYHPTTGCSKNCEYCWARPLVRNRLAGTMRGLPPEVVCQEDPTTKQCDPFYPTFHVNRLADPLRARKPQVIGVSFLGDLFDLGITDKQIAAVFGVMAAANWHTFIVLTKQTARMAAWFRWVYKGPCAVPDIKQETVRGRCIDHARRLSPAVDKHQQGLWGGFNWPLLNIWLGVSATNQADADERIPHLLRAPAAHRWISYEPAVDGINFDSPEIQMVCDGVEGPDIEALTGERIPHIDAIVLGGESGPGARPLDLAWVRSVRDQCAAAGVPFAFKQRSGMRPEHKPFLDGRQHWNIPWLAGR